MVRDGKVGQRVQQVSRPLFGYDEFGTIHEVAMPVDDWWIYIVEMDDSAEGDKYNGQRK
jgi:hypothetical protein